MTSQAIEDAVDKVEGLEPRDRKRLEYFTKQIVDMMAPTNFLGTNPEALERAVETEGESLVKGLENLVRDIEANRGEVLVTLADVRVPMSERCHTAAGFDSTAQCCLEAHFARRLKCKGVPGDNLLHDKSWQHVLALIGHTCVSWRHGLECVVAGRSHWRHWGPQLWR